MLRVVGDSMIDAAIRDAASSASAAGERVGALRSGGLADLVDTGCRRVLPDG
ncbi:hypothetical protein [Streptomyces sp. NBC_01353]|uniref:hypothetical protein n=1 Tax=Streptomyces sp. NBC_01353 TaxID=2903835 RepID=UPI002E3075E6|nr:hypothetical protein [Streptomyces sp. NBC_01353]